MAAARSDAGFIHSVTSDPRCQLVEVTEDLNHTRRMRGKKCGTITGARLLQEQCQKGGRRYKVAMVTLTYRDIDGYNARHISALLHSVRQYLRRRGEKLRYVWVLELQKRGAPHYHLLVWLPKGLTLPKPDKRGWWPHGMTKIEWARNAVGYIAKYAAKEEAVRLIPRGARIHACGGLDAAGARERRWWLFPAWVRDWAVVDDDCARIPGGGFVKRVSGEWVPSPWRVLILNGALTLIRISYEN